MCYPCVVSDKRALKKRSGRVWWHIMERSCCPAFQKNYGQHQMRNTPAPDNTPRRRRLWTNFAEKMLTTPQREIRPLVIALVRGDLVRGGDGELCRYILPTSQRPYRENTNNISDTLTTKNKQHHRDFAQKAQITITERKRDYYTSLSRQY